MAWSPTRYRPWVAVEVGGLRVRFGGSGLVTMVSGLRGMVVGGSQPNGGGVRAVRPVAMEPGWWRTPDGWRGGG